VLGDPIVRGLQERKTVGSTFTSEALKITSEVIKVIDRDALVDDPRCFRHR
jgi:hypothetical protein